MRTLDHDRLWRRLMDLGAISDAGEGTSRTSFGDAFQAGREFLAEEFRDAGLRVFVDHAGNLHGRLDGRRAETLLIGGHSDTVPNGGRFDGALGVLSALDIAQTIGESGNQPEYSIEVIDFLAEEPSAFGLSCIGSRGFAGRLTPVDLERRDPGGERLGDALRRVGGDPSQLGPVDPERDFLGFLELHIEQGPVLAERSASLGVVTDIAGIVRYRFRVEGAAAHAGTTPMAKRRDALVAAGRFASNIYESVAGVQGLVGTVGQFAVFPNAANVVPGRVEGVAEFRSASRDLPNSASAIMTAALPERDALGCAFSFEEYMRTEPVGMSPRLQTVIRKSIERSGATSVALFSGAGHDAVEVSRRAEVGMMFCPCRDGISHSPAEWVEPGDVARALAAYRLAVLSLVSADDVEREE